MPAFGLLFGFAAMASVGLPGFANFAAELMIFFGAFSAGTPVKSGFNEFQIATVVAVWGVVISAVFMLRCYRRIFMGPIGDKWKALPDIATLPRLCVAGLIAASSDRRIFPAGRPQLRRSRADLAMIAVPPFALEICVVCVGIFLLMMDCFTKLDKRSLGLAAICRTACRSGPVVSDRTDAQRASSPQDFYVADPPALFFKRFILLSTILTIALAMDYAPVYERFIPSGGPQAGCGRVLHSADFHVRGLDVDGLRRGLHHDLRFAGVGDHQLLRARGEHAKEHRKP